MPQEKLLPIQIVLMLQEQLLTIQFLWLLTNPSDAARTSPHNSIPLDAARKVPSNSNHSNAARKGPPNSTEVIMVDDEMTIETDTHPNIMQNKLPADSHVLQSRNRVATEDHKEIDKVDIADKVA